MKSFLRTALVAGCLFFPAIRAQTVTTPVGYSGETLHPGMNLFGLSVHQPVIVTGRLGEIGADFVHIAAIDDRPASAAASPLPLVDGETYILEILTGDKAGVIQELTTWHDLRLSVADDLATAGVAAGDRFAIRRAPTLDDVFPPATTPLQALAGPGTEPDILFLPIGASFGEFRRCILVALPDRAPVWMDPAARRPVGDTRLVYPDGVIIHRKAPRPVHIGLPGEIKSGPTRSVVHPGLNLLATPSPGIHHLQDLGLDPHLLRHDLPTEADRVWLPDPHGTGTFRTFFLNADRQWCDGATAQPLEAPVSVGSAILLERLGPAALITLGE